MRRVQPTIADDGQRPCPGESHLTASGLSPEASTELGLMGQQDDGAGLGHLKGQLAVDDNSLDGDPVTVCVLIQNNSGIAVLHTGDSHGNLAGLGIDIDVADSADAQILDGLDAGNSSSLCDSLLADDSGQLLLGVASVETMVL